MLGDIIARLDDPGSAEAALIEAGDLMLLTDVAAAANALGMKTGDFAALAVRRFVERADDDRWLQLIGVMGRSERPGLDALSAILKAAVADVREAVA
jgi:hypothetical protein